MESNHAHVLLDDGQVLHIPLSELDASIRVSSVVEVRAQSIQRNADAADDSRQKLNDILSSRPE